MHIILIFKQEPDALAWPQFVVNDQDSGLFSGRIVRLAGSVNRGKCSFVHESLPPKNVMLEPKFFRTGIRMLGLSGEH